MFINKDWWVMSYQFPPHGQTSCLPHTSIFISLSVWYLYSTEVCGLDRAGFKLKWVENLQKSTHFCGGLRYSKIEDPYSSLLVCLSMENVCLLYVILVMGLRPLLFSALVCYTTLLKLCWWIPHLLQMSAVLLFRSKFHIFGRLVWATWAFL